MARVVKCAGRFPVGPIQPSLARRTWCQIAAVVLRLLGITLISPVSSLLLPALSPPAVFFSFLFPPPLSFLHVKWRLEGSWGRDHPFILCFCLLPRSLLAWHSSNTSSKAKWYSRCPTIPGRLRGEWVTWELTAVGKKHSSGEPSNELFEGNVVLLYLTESICIAEAWPVICSALAACTCCTFLFGSC